MREECKPCKAIEPKDLADSLMNPNFPKSEREHYAVRVIEAADALAKEFEWVRQTVHRAHHDGEMKDCFMNTCDAANKALAAYEKLRGK